MTILALNTEFLGAARRALGTWFAVRAAVFLPVMYFYHGVGLIAGVVTYLYGGSVARRRAPPEPVYQILEGPAEKSTRKFPYRDMPTTS